MLGDAMAFRADEAAQAGFDRAYQYLIPEGANSSQRLKVRELLQDIVRDCGPVVDGYPAWHPFMQESDRSKWSPYTPNNLDSFKGLDHTIYFQNGILTCPYGHGVDELFNRMQDFDNKDAAVTIKKIQGITLYHENAIPILIKCEWYGEWREYDGTFNLKTAMGLMLEREVPNWRVAKFNESWEVMSGQIIGEPHGARSSLFVNQVTGQQLKSVWNQIIKSGLFGVSKD